MHDQNGNRVHYNVAREGDGWGTNVFFGGGTPGSIVTAERRYVYRTREQARNGDISDNIGQRGRIA